ncbi:hypothetical protein [Dictyobacter formicarum]|uniref:Uncharacterized protein n=1 Tax=Dictyobacter formicarum TaxID=2778368 RepID=A0ABQ3VR69_9CHLR|nr:hypothetical protein [Dictyobacter formicarum]GHO88204.1 hypothetical protein KSZ_62100 [Dictyobacter formicarum]
MNLKTFKRHCEQYANHEGEDDNVRNAYREILQHIEIHRIQDRDGLILDLAHLAEAYLQRAARVRQVAPISMVADTLETKARVYKEAIQQLGGIRL